MYVAISIILGLVTVVAGCGDTPELSVDVSDGPVNFTQVYNILQGKCVPCHNPNASGGLTWTDLDSAYAHLVGVTAPGGPCIAKTERSRALTIRHACSFGPSPASGASSWPYRRRGALRSNKSRTARN